MNTLSAADAIAPAIRRTRIFLFQPFRWGTFLKLCLVALVTEGLGNFRSSQGGGGSHGGGPVINSPFDLSPVWIASMVAMALLVILLVCFVYYLITRLRFAYFHCLVHNTKEIRPGWEIYRPQAMRFFWLNVAVGCCFVLLVGLMILPFAAGLWRLFREAQAGGHVDVGSVLSFVLPMIPIILLVVVAGILMDMILRDWMLPHMALENATAGQAWAAVWDRVSGEKGQFFAYALLRLILPILAWIVVFVVLLIPGLILAGALAAVIFGIHAAFANATGAAEVAGVALQVFFGAVAFVFAVLASICVGGPVSTGLREYALLFYGGRYQRLGDILSSPSHAGIA